MSAVVWAVLALALVLGGVIFWSVLERAGLPQRLTEFMVEITLIDEGAQPFANVEQFFRVMVFGSVVWWVTMTGAPWPVPSSTTWCLTWWAVSRSWSWRRPSTRLLPPPRHRSSIHRPTTARATAR